MPTLPATSSSGAALLWQKITGAFKTAPAQPEQPAMPAGPLAADARIGAISQALHEAAAAVRANGIQRLVLFVEPYKTLEEAAKDCKDVLAAYGKLVCTDYYQEHLLDPREVQHFKGRQLAAQARAYTAVALIQLSDHGGMVPSFVSLPSEHAAFVPLNPPNRSLSCSPGKVFFELSYRIPFTGRFLPAMVADNSTYCNLRVLLDPEKADQLQLAAGGMLQEGKGPDDIRAAVSYARSCYETNLAGLMAGLSGFKFPAYPAGSS